MADLIWSLSLITSNIFGVENGSEEDVGWWRKIEEDTLLFSFSSPRNPRIVLGLSPERRSISSFVHAKKNRTPPKPHTPKKVFSLSFPLISYGEKLSLVGRQKGSLFMVVVQNRLNIIRARVCCNSNHFEFQFNFNFFSPLSNLKRDLSKKFGHEKQSETLPFLTHNRHLHKKPTCGRIGIGF